MTQFNVHCYLDTGFMQHVSSFSYEYNGTCRSEAQLCVKLLNLYIPLPALQWCSNLTLKTFDVHSIEEHSSGGNG